MQPFHPLSNEKIAVLRMTNEQSNALFSVRRISDNLTGVIVDDQANHVYRLVVPYVSVDGKGSFLNIMMNSLHDAISEMEEISLSE